MEEKSELPQPTRLRPCVFAILQAIFRDRALQQGRSILNFCVIIHFLPVVCCGRNHRGYPDRSNDFCRWFFPHGVK